MSIVGARIGDQPMFESSRIMWYFSDLGNRAGLSKSEVKQVTQVIDAGQLMLGAIEFAKIANDMKAGAVHLAVSVAKLAAERNAPLEVRATVLRLFNIAKYEIESFSRKNTFAHSILRNMAEEFELKVTADFLNSGYGSNYPEEKINKTSSGHHRSISEVFMSEMPSSERSKPPESFAFGNYIIRYYENPVTIGETLGLPNIFKFPQVAVVTKNNAPVCMIRIEQSMFDTSAIGVVFPNGMHSTYDRLIKADKDIFINEVIRILREIEIEQ